MSDENKHIKDSVVAHMSMIQGIITRLETNCFTLKTLAMTLSVAIIAFIGSIQNPTIIYPVAGYFPIFVFWLMDAQYLRLGRLYRKLFVAVKDGETNKPFTMDIQPYKTHEKSILRIAFSWSILWFYLSIFIMFSLIVVKIYYY